MKKNLPAVLIGFFTILLVVGLILLAINQSTSSAQTAGTPGKPIATGANEVNFSLKGIDGHMYTLSNYIGKSAVFIEFFALWCPHCQNEAPTMEALSNQYKGKVQFFSVQASPYGHTYEETGDTAPATIDDFNWFKGQFGITYPMLQDASIATADKYGVQGFPTFVLINKSGKVAFTNASSGGEMSQASLEDQINQVI